jgi:ABC-2 type transport system ATP-binding protein
MIETKGLRKSFRVKKRRQVTTVNAVNGLDLHVAEGEIFGFLGPNGAGKTTTLRMLATLLIPDDGDATVAGINLRNDPAKVRRNVGYVAQGGGTWDDVTAREELVLQARMYGIDKAEAGVRAAAALEAFQLSDFGDRRVKTYSGGQRRRVDIALGVIHRPKVLFLDEPTSSLDPQSRANVWEEVRQLRSDGMTIFLTTHYMDEADALCDRISIIDAGDIVAEGTPTELKREISGDVISLGILDGAAAKASEVLTGASFVRSTEVRGDNMLRLTVDAGETAMPQIMRTLGGANIEMSTIELHRPTLDDVFLAKTGRSLRAPER